MQTIVLYLCYIVLILLFSTAYDTSLIYCFVIWCLHTREDPAPLRSRAIRRLVLVGGNEHPEEVLPTLLWIAHLGGTVAPRGKTAGGWDGSLLEWFRKFFCTYRL